MLIYYQGGPVTITLMTISLGIHQPSITKITLKITYLKFLQNIPGANELTRPHSQSSEPPSKMFFTYNKVFNTANEEFEGESYCHIERIVKSSLYEHVYQ